MSDYYFYVSLPTEGEFFVKDGVVYTVLESEAIDCEDDGTVAWTVYTEPVE